MARVTLPELVERTSLRDVPDETLVRAKQPSAEDEDVTPMDAVPADTASTPTICA